MDESVKQEWTDALRSGEYEQALGGLRKNDKFCCLGVLCDLYKENTGDGEWSQMTKAYEFITSGNGEHSRDSGVLPDEVVEWAGLSSRQGTIVPAEELPFTTQVDYNLAELNDAEKSFDLIADLIERDL